MSEALIPLDLFPDLTGPVPTHRWDPVGDEADRTTGRLNQGDATPPIAPECIERVRRHDQEAARELVEALYPLVLRIVRANLPRRAAEEDLAQEIFARIFHHLSQYQGKVPIEHWVSRIAVNHCLNAIRAQKNRPEWRMADLTEEQAHVLEGLPGESAVADRAHQTGEAELAEYLLACLEPEDRLVLRMLEVEDRTVEEIQQATGWSSALVRVRAFRARQRLNKRFGQLRREGRL